MLKEKELNIITGGDMNLIPKRYSLNFSEVANLCETINATTENDKIFYSILYAYNWGFYRGKRYQLNKTKQANGRKK